MNILYWIIIFYILHWIFFECFWMVFVVLKFSINAQKFAIRRQIKSFAVSLIHNNRTKSFLKLISLNWIFLQSHRSELLQDRSHRALTLKICQIQIIFNWRVLIRATDFLLFPWYSIVHQKFATPFFLTDNRNFERPQSLPSQKKP